MHNFCTTVLYTFLFTFVDCGNVFKCLFNAGKREIEIYKILLKGSKRVDEICKIVGKDRSTVQRILNKLVKCKIVRREKRIIKNGGGYYFIYKAVPPDKLKKWLEECIEDWKKEMKEALKNLEEFIIS